MPAIDEVAALRAQYAAILGWSDTVAGPYSLKDLEFFVNHQEELRQWDKRFLIGTGGGGGQPGPGGLILIDNGDDTYTAIPEGVTVLTKNLDDTVTFIPAGAVVVTDNGNDTVRVTGYDSTS